MKKLLIGIFLLSAVAHVQHVYAQAGSGTKYGPKQQVYVDSIKNSVYKWKMPIYGKKLSAKGFDVPFNSGVSVNTYIAAQKVVISDLKVGFNDNPPVPLDFVKFGDVTANIQSVTVRPDVWIFPFLDVYAIGGLSYAKTNVTLTAPIAFSTEANFHGNTFGLGTTLAGGFHGIIIIVDVNHTWTHLNNIKGAIKGTMVDPRVGMNFLLKNKPDKSFAVWIGGQGFFINRTTEGTINVGDLVDPNASRPDLDGIINGTSDWYQNLGPAQKVVVKQIAQAIANKLDGLDVKDATISYSLKKRPVSEWSMTAGGQFQFSHTWQVRTEFGFLGGRSSWLLSLNYRFRAFRDRSLFK